ncbi:hypothetical protein ACIOGX_24280 [Streptomyces sp. NPDC088147]|uniref:hypothetical protein n=1 Tax=Streptomyces sp. NPDC088147 TaxID=3365830 RepID=UPI003815AA9C
MATEAYSESWQELIDLAGQERQSAASGPMSLASAGGSGGSGGAASRSDLEHSDGPWTTAAGVAEALRTSTTTAKSRLTSTHTGVTAATEGLASSGVLKAVLTSWEDRLSSVRDECGSLAPKLRQVGKDLGERDTKVKSSLQGINTPSDPSDLSDLSDLGEPKEK